MMDDILYDQFVAHVQLCGQCRARAPETSGPPFPPAPPMCAEGQRLEKAWGEADAAVTAADDETADCCDDNRAPWSPQI